MKRILIPFIAAFGLSLGAGTGAAIMRAPKTPAAGKASAAAKTTAKPVAKESPALRPDSATKVARVGATAERDTLAARAPKKPVDSVRVADNKAPSAPSGAVSDRGGQKNSPSASSSAPTSQVAKSTQGVQQPAASVPVATQPESKPGAPAAARAVAVSEKAPAPTKSTAVPKGPATDTLATRRIAQVFGAMQAKDAARVLEQMDDEDVRTILASLNNKQQAAILEVFPTQRAATIARATLRTRGSL